MKLLMSNELADFTMIVLYSSNTDDNMCATATCWIDRNVTNMHVTAEHAC